VRSLPDTPTRRRHRAPRPARHGACIAQQPARRPSALRNPAPLEVQGTHPCVPVHQAALVHWTNGPGSPLAQVTRLASRGKRRAGLGRPSGAAQSLLRFGVQGLPPCMPVRGSYPAAHPWPAPVGDGGCVRDARLQRYAFHAPLEVQGIRPVCPFTGLRWSTGPTVPAHPWLAVVSFSCRSSWKLFDARPRKGQRRLTGTGLDHPPSPFGHPTK